MLHDQCTNFKNSNPKKIFLDATGNIFHTSSLEEHHLSRNTTSSTYLLSLVFLTLINAAKKLLAAQRMNEYE